MAGLLCLKTDLWPSLAVMLDLVCLDMRCFTAKGKAGTALSLSAKVCHLNQAYNAFF